MNEDTKTQNTEGEVCAPTKTGRPPKTPGQPKRSAFNTRIRTALKAELQAEADKNGRSLSEEIEHRLEMSVLIVETTVYPYRMNPVSQIGSGY